VAIPIRGAMGSMLVVMNVVVVGVVVKMAEVVVVVV